MAVYGGPQTGRRCFSASATAAFQPPLASMSGPATSAGLRADSSRLASCASSAGSGTARPSTTRRRACTARSSSASRSQSSIGIDTNAGPWGGSVAWWMARPIAPGTSWARGGSWLHFTYGCGTTMASRLVSSASWVTWARTCWPAVMTSGALFARAVQIAPTALPTPGAVCRLTWVGFPVAWAYPSAMPTTACS